MTGVDQGANADLLVQAVDTLHQFIKMLFPDPNPDVFTLDDFQFRYKLRMGLAEAATRAIEQSQRINRSAGDYEQAGLCEFHVGLIYLDSNEFRGAQQQFLRAQQQWGFVYEPAGEALARLAEGIAQHLALHYEAAMACYRKANQSLPRIRFAPTSHYDDRFVSRLADSIATYQALLHTQLWPVTVETEPIPADVTPPSSPPAETAPTLTESPTPPLPTPPTQPEIQVPEAEPVPAAADSTPPPDGDRTALPIVTFDTKTTPIPGHQYLHDEYEWFLIERQPSVGFFPMNVQQGGWVLVDKKPNLEPGEIVLVIGNEEDARQNGRIIVSPVKKTRPYPRIYLAWLEDAANAVTDAHPSYSDEAEHVPITVSPEMRRILVKIQEILGVVVGFWLPVQIR